jgi:hypothetical protein
MIRALVVKDAGPHTSFYQDVRVACKIERIVVIMTPMELFYYLGATCSLITCLTYNLV